MIKVESKIFLNQCITILKMYYGKGLMSKREFTKRQASNYVKHRNKISKRNLFMWSDWQYGKMDFEELSKKYNLSSTTVGYVIREMKYRQIPYIKKMLNWGIGYNSMIRAEQEN